MKVPVANAPHLIEHFWEMAKRYHEYHAEYLEKAAAATDPVVKEVWEQMAESELKVARTMQSDADALLEKFIAAGGSYEAKH
jgi:hypothetical protein